MKTTLKPETVDREGPTIANSPKTIIDRSKNQPSFRDSKRKVVSPTRYSCRHRGSLRAAGFTLAKAPSEKR